jgi:transcriptional regulator with XRE-family HTH domain
MPGRERRVPRAEWRVGRDLAEAGDELRRARLRHGLTLRTVAHQLGVSHVTVLRTERAALPGPTPLLLARHAAAVGMSLRLRVHPGNQTLHDAGQVALMRRFRARIGPVGQWAAEVPIPADRDQRAFDAVLTLPAGRVALEFYVRLTDAQAQLRSAHLKKRDANMERLLIVLADTPTNRRAMHEAGSALGDLAPGNPRELLASLARGAIPAADGIVLI